MATSTSDPEFVLEHRGFVRALARELVFDADLARDVEQETWLAALSNAPRERASPRAWLAGIVRKIALKTWRSKLRRGDRELAFAREKCNLATPDELLERESLRREIVEAVVALDEPWRAALIARYFEELTPEQAAVRLGVPLETLRTRLKRGRELLRERLTRRLADSGANLALVLVGAWRLEPPSYSGLLAALLKEIVVVSATQKVFAAVAAVTLIVASLWLWRGEVASRPALSASSGVLSNERVEPLPAKQAVTLERGAGRIAIDASSEKTLLPEVASRFGSLRLHLVWADDKSPAAGVWMRIHQRAADDPFRASCDARSDSSGDVFVEQVFAGAVTLKLDRGVWSDVDVVAGIDNSATIEIPAGYSVTGTVVDFDGRPFAGAQLYLQTFGGSYEGFVVGYSATDGSFNIRGLAPRVGISVSARAAGRTPTKQHAFNREAGEAVVLRLGFESLGGAIGGRVLAPDGAALAGARVLIGSEYDPTPVALGDGSFGHPPAAQLARTDERGEFSLDGIPEGLQPVRVRADGFAPWKGEVEIVAGRTSHIDVSLSPGASLSGVVRDEAGLPLSKVEIWAAREDDISASSFRRTQADGSFEMRDLPLGEIKLEADGGERGFADVALFTVAGGEYRWDPVLATGAKFCVQLIAPGHELAGWRITVEHRPSLVDAYADTQTTGVDGKVVFVNVPDVELRLSLRAPGPPTYPRAIRDGVRARDGELVIQPDPALEPTIFLRGRIVADDGKPLGATRVAPLNPRLFYPPVGVADAQTGRFEFGPLPAGDWSIQGFMPGFAKLRSASVHVDAGGSFDFGDLRIQRGGTVAAKLVLEGAKGEAAISAELHDAAGEVESLVVEGDIAHSAVVAPGHYTLIARCAKHAGQVELEVRAEQEAQVSVVLRLP